MIGSDYDPRQIEEALLRNLGIEKRLRSGYVNKEEPILPRYEDFSEDDGNVDS
jgi:hypothetical protein